MKFRLNRKSLERLKALVRAGDYVDRAWSFTAADSNALLRDPANWTEYSLWFLGYEQGKPDTLAENGATDQTPTKDWYAYPFGKGEAVNLAALRDIIKQAKAAGENDIADAAAGVLATAEAAQKDAARAHAKLPDITFAASVKIKAATAAPKGPPTFEMVAYTGGAMKLDGWDYPVVVDLEGIDFTKHPRPILKDHDPAKPLGHTETIEVKGMEIHASGPLSGPVEHVYPVVDAANKGFPWQASIGATPIEREFVPAFQTAEANGRTFAGPVNIARRSSLREISILSLGADDDTRTRIAARAAKGTRMKLKSKFAAWTKARGINMADMENDGVAAATKALYKAQMKCEADDPDDSDYDPDTDTDKKKTDSAAPAPEIRAGAPANGNAASIAAVADLTKELRAAAVAERQRISAITTVLEEYRPQVDAAKFAPIEAKAIGGEYDRDKTELELIKARRPTMNAPNINTGAGGMGSQHTDGQIVAAAASASMGVGIKHAMRGLDERASNIAASMRGLTIHGIIAMSAAQLGMHVAPGGINDDFLRDFLRQDKASHRQQIEVHRRSAPIHAAGVATGGFTTMSLTGITENIMYKTMLEQYELQVSVVSEIAFERDTNDLKPFKVYRVTASGDLQLLGPTGELKAMGLQDESYSNQVATRGALMILKREDLLNDDMGALLQTPQVFGRKSALHREKAVITTFLSGLTTVAPGASVGKTANGFNFWSTGANNYMSGAPSALQISALTTAEQKFIQQTDANGDPIGILPDRILVCPELKTTAFNLFNGANVIASALGSTSAKTVEPNINRFATMYRPIVSPYLGGSSTVTGKSSTQWALLPNPAGGFATVQVGYLRGQRTPMIQQVDTDAAMLGIAYQGIYDFGVALLDYRCGVYSAGA